MNLILLLLACVNQERARHLLQQANKRTEQRAHRLQVAKWAYDTNITAANLRTQLKVGNEQAQEARNDWKRVNAFDWSAVGDYDLRRQFSRISNLGSAALPSGKFTKLKRIISKMKEIYSTSKTCVFDNNRRCDLRLDPDLIRILGNSRNPRELKHVWIKWHNAVGPLCRKMYEEYVQLKNEAARLNGYRSAADPWLVNYEDPTFALQVERLWHQLRPFYLQLHAYVRTRLRKKYGDSVSRKGPLPVHLLGNMWGQKWGTLANFTLPYPERGIVDLTDELKKQNYTPMAMYKTAEDFFLSIGLSAMPRSFWTDSLLEKPKDRNVVCHPSAWDFHNGQDFRIKHCASVTEASFLTAHHEMGHIEYYLQYRDLPIVYRTGANDGFHEAIGDLVSLSVRSRKHLKKIGLIKDRKDDPRDVLNSLFLVALDKIPLLPWAFLVDLWRWDVFKGLITPNQYNCRWWELREMFQGVEPPVKRTEKDFDPAAKYHVVADVPFLRYFVSLVIQFQFHRALCNLAGEYVPQNPDKPLHNCDIYQSTEAGNALKKMLAMGASRPWPDALEALTGQRTMDASALLEYFQPVYTWLQMENWKSGTYIGWEKSKKGCSTR